MHLSLPTTLLPSLSLIRMCLVGRQKCSPPNTGLHFAYFSGNPAGRNKLSALSVLKGAEASSLWLDYFLSTRAKNTAWALLRCRSLISYLKVVFVVIQNASVLCISHVQYRIGSIAAPRAATATAEDKHRGRQPAFELRSRNSSLWPMKSVAGRPARRSRSDCAPNLSSS